MAQQNFSGDRQAVGQDDAGGERTDAGGDRADEHEACIPRKRRRRHDKRRAAPGLFTAKGRVEVDPDEIAGIGPIF